MRLLVYEHFCGGGQAGGSLDATLLPEGAGMLRSLVEDIHACGHLPVVPLDERVPLTLPGMVVPIGADRRTAADDPLDRLLATVDAAIVVAPEHDGLLADLVARVERAGVANLGSSAAAIRTASDKRRLGERLRDHGIRTPLAAATAAEAAGLLGRHAEVIAKPNRGAGCVDTFVCRSAADLARLPHRADWLFQERIAGRAASVAFVLPRSGPPVPLRAGLQEIREVPAPSADTPVRLGYFGGRLPLDAALERRAIALAGRAIGCLPELHGLVGLDLVLGGDADGDAIIEVNPRPTVAYSALRRLARFNIAGILLGETPRIAWTDGAVEYRADGGCRFLP